MLVPSSNRLELHQRKETCIVTFRETPEKFRISIKQARHFEMPREQTGPAPPAKLL